jgi:clan AA aspartic protease
MIQGTVNADLQPLIQLSITAADGTDHSVEAMVDSGFNGWLTLPPAMTASLQLTWLQRGQAVLADGNTVFFNIYQASILWDGGTLTVPVDEAEGIPLVGMLLLQGYELKIHAVIGGSVEIRLP